MNPADGRPVKPIVEPLSRREREILALLAQGYTGPDIARQLSIALSSVRTHLLHLYGKLGVSGKSSALNRARAMGLLEPHPPAATPAALRHNLPVALTRFFGRELETAQLKELLAENRLVTISGAGGVGKTRLSQWVAEAVLDDCLDGVWFVDLAPLADPALVAQQVASSLGLRDESRRPVLETLTTFLRDRQLLLVLDNCEHLLDACAWLADTLLRACPRLTILATSREPLGSAGEAVFPAPSLPFPGPGQPVSLESLAVYPSVRLFVDRARLVAPDYQITPGSAAALAAICQRLEGIPLAIEMAAARMNTLSAEQLAGLLDDAFRVIGGGQRTALPRQQTLRATMDWSYELLGQAERSLLQRLSVFAGGCTLEAAEVVCAGEGRPAAGSIEAGQAILAPVVGAEIVERLSILVAKSMVISRRQADQDARYYLLETVRQYARGKLREAGEMARLHTRHRDYFLAFAKQIIPKLQTADYTQWAAKVRAEEDNLRQAMEWSFSDVSLVEPGLRLLIALGTRYWSAHAEILSWHQRGLDWCERQPGLAGQLHAKLLEHAAWYSGLDDPPATLALALRGVAVSRGLGPEHKETLMWSLVQLGWTYMAIVGDADQAAAPLDEAEALLEALGPNFYAPAEALRVRAYLDFHRGTLALHQRRYQDAKVHGAECLRLYELSGSRQFTRAGHSVLGDAYVGLKDYPQAREHILAIEKFDPASGDTDTLTRLARVDILLGELDRALDYARASIRAALQIPDRNHIASNLGLMAIVHAYQGEAARAALLSGASAAMWTRQKRKPWEDSSLDTILPGWREAPDQAALTAAFEDGQALSADQAIALALDEKSRP
jgi:predicted ATPase/DNA-binding CsgD family transcriptional regulator